MGMNIKEVEFYKAIIASGTCPPMSKRGLGLGLITDAWGAPLRGNEYKTGKCL